MALLSFSLKLSLNLADVRDVTFMRECHSLDSYQIEN